VAADAQAALARLRDRIHGVGYAGDPIVDVETVTQGLADQAALLRDVAESDVTFDYSGERWVEVQIDRAVWTRLRARAGGG